VKRRGVGRFPAGPISTALGAPQRPASKWSRANLDRIRSEAPKGDHAPDRLDDAEGPSSREKAIGAGKKAAECKGQDERPAPSLGRVHDHHEAEGQDAMDGNERHTPVCAEADPGRRDPLVPKLTGQSLPPVVGHVRLRWETAVN
jgi:hypothetical protein